MQKHKLVALIILITMAITTQACTPDAAAAGVAVEPTSAATAIELTVTGFLTDSAPLPDKKPEITYKYIIKRTGDIPLRGTASVTGTNVTCPVLTTIGNLDDIFDMGETLECTSKYSVTQTDLDSGSVTINVVATVGDISSTPATTTTKVKELNDILTLSITANPTTYSQVGQMIAITYDIKNSSTKELGPAQFTVKEKFTTGFHPFESSEDPLPCGPENKTLAPNEIISCTLSYKVKQADIDEKDPFSIIRDVTASGGGAGPSKPSNITITKGISSLILISLANPLTYNQSGQEIAFAYSIQNTGTVSLGPAQFTVNVKGTTWALPCGPENKTLAPNEAVSCTTKYFVQQTELDYPSLTFSYYAQGGGQKRPLSP